MFNSSTSHWVNTRAGSAWPFVRNTHCSSSLIRNRRFAREPRRHGRKRAEKAWRLCADCPVLRNCAEQTARDIESGRIPVGVVVAGAAYHDNASNGRRTDAYRTLEFLIGRPLSNPAA